MRRNNGALAIAFVKWVVVPVGLAAVGYFFVGPTVARSYMQGTVPEEIRPVVQPVEPTRSKSTGEPKVEVTSQPVKQSVRRRSKPKPVEPAPETAPDENPEPETQQPEGAQETGNDPGNGN